MQERSQEGKVVLAFFCCTVESFLPCHLELKATLLQTSCYACFRSCLPMVSSLCSGLRAEEAGGERARLFLAGHAARQPAGKGAVFTLQAQQRNTRKDVVTWGERAARAERAPQLKQ